MDRKFKVGELVQVEDSLDSYEIHGYAAGEYGYITSETTGFKDVYNIHFPKLGRYNALEKNLISNPHLKIKHGV